MHMMREVQALKALYYYWFTIKGTPMFFLVSYLSVTVFPDVIVYYALYSTVKPHMLEVMLSHYPA